MELMECKTEDIGAQLYLHMMKYHKIPIGGY